MAYQPIVDWRNRTIVAYEALVRCNDPALPNPGAIFSAAERLDRVHEVGRAIRARIALSLDSLPPGRDLFINVHPSDLLDETLYAPDSPLVSNGGRIVLEVTERAPLDGRGDIGGRVRRLRDLGFRVAVDDLGAGYAGLTYLTLLVPEVVKIDVALVRDIHRDEIKRKLVGSLATLCRDLGMVVVAEGVETGEERDAVSGLGCDLLQGYLFARPGRPFPDVAWA
jgi:EAL domain-containing protein (putative c-di-GMP-specific phosphodiesterase class I)